jgi:hypothetical protein
MNNEKVLRNLLLAVLAGFILGAATVTAIGYTGAKRASSQLNQLKSALADSQRSNDELASELRSARALAEQHRELDEEIASSLSEGMAAISKARTDYERGLAQLRFAAKIFDLLRRRYDPSYQGASEEDH